MLQYSDFIIPIAETKEKKATRDAYGRALEKLGEEDERIVALDADLSGSTRTGWFAKKFPHRFFNVGIAEQNMVGVSAGLALGGHIPFASSFAVFLTGRAWEPVRQSICYPNLNVKLVASHSGITVGEDGGSHQSLEDISLTRVLPNLRVLVPADAVQTERIIRYVHGEKGPFYVRTGRPSTPIIYKDDYVFDAGKPDIIIQGKDILIITMGVLVSQAMQACEQLAKKNIFPTLLNLHTIKPLSEDALLDIASQHKVALTFEEHSIYGGMGSAVSEFLSERHPMRVFRFGMTGFGKSGTPDELLKKFELDADHIADKVAKVAAQQ